MSSNSSNPWGPNEPASTVVSEEAWLQGETVSAIAYGAELVLFIQCFILLFKQTKRTDCKAKLPLLIITCLIFMFGTFFMGSAMKFNQLAFIEDRNFPGGPSAFENIRKVDGPILSNIAQYWLACRGCRGCGRLNLGLNIAQYCSISVNFLQSPPTSQAEMASFLMNDEFAIPVDALGNVSFVLSNWLCDALLIWRYKIIYKASTCRLPMWIIMAPPIITFMGSFAMGILFLLQVSSASPFVNTALNWTIPYFSLSLALNILVSLAIVGRLLFCRYRIASIFGSTYGAQYTGIAAMIIESASLFSLFLLSFLVPFAINSSIAEVFMQSMGQVQSCATLLIIFRTASGKAWSTTTQQTFDTVAMHFTTQTSPGGSRLDRGVIGAMPGRRAGYHATNASLQAVHLSEKKTDSAFTANRVMFTTDTTVHTDVDTNSSGEDIAGTV